MSVFSVFCWTVLFASFFEWILHRFFIHRPLLGITYAFKAHAITHHQTFGSDHTYHLVHEKDKKTIPMAIWNGPALVAFTTALFSTMIWLVSNEWHPWTIGITMAAYYGAYEYMHWCMHLPRPERERLFEKIPLLRWGFIRLNGHHLLHHRHMSKNFNVVLPLADLLLRTLLIRTGKPFTQARGPLVPDVQPRYRAFPSEVE